MKIRLFPAISLIIQFAVIYGTVLQANGQTPIIPREGTFFIEARPAFRFKATLTDRWTSSYAYGGTLRVFAPIPPELPSQGDISADLSMPNYPAFVSRRINERSNERRAKLCLDVNAGGIVLKSGAVVRLEYSGILYSRRIALGSPAKPVPPLSDNDRKLYLAPSRTVDYMNAGWIA
jgi:hypothetical protein